MLTIHQQVKNKPGRKILENKAVKDVIKLIIFNLDGVLNHRWNLLKELKKRFKELQTFGTAIAINCNRDPLGVLYYVYNSKFPFNYIGCGGGAIIENPFSKKSIKSIFKSQLTTNLIETPGMDKIDRAITIMELSHVPQNEALIIDYNPKNEFNKEKTKLKLSCYLASTHSDNDDWINYLHEYRYGYYTDESAPMGIFPILKHFNLSLSENKNV